MSIGGDSSSTRSTSGNSSTSQNASRNVSNSDSFVDPNQSPFLRGLYGLSSGFANPQGQQGAAAQAGYVNNPALQRSITGISALTDPNAQIAAQTKSLQSGLGRLFREEINPGIESSAISAGGLGGGRQGVAQGVATGQLASAYTEGVGDIVARANQTATSAGAILPQLTQSLLQSRLAPQTAGMDVLGQLSQILGSPTVLQRSRADATASGSSAAQSSTDSKSGSSGFNASLGGFFGF